MGDYDFEDLIDCLKENKKLLVFLFFLVKETLDCSFDWLLYRDLNIIEEGLVYGPVENWILNALLIFCCIGTVTAVIDIVNRFRDLRNDSPFVNTGITGLCVMVFEDIPQLILGLVVLLCRGEAISQWTTIKAVILVIGSIITIGLTIRNCAQNKKLRNDEKIKCIPGLILATIIVFILSGMTCVIILKVGSEESRIESYIKSERKNEIGENDGHETRNINDRYFSDVGIYGNIADLLFPVDELGNITWILFFDIYTIRRYHEITTKLTIATDLSRVMIINIYKFRGKKLDFGYWCYILQRGFDVFYKNVDYRDCSFFNGTQFHYHFQYIPPSKYHLLGDIQYNVKICYCDYFDLTRVPHLRYFRLNLAKNETYGHLYSSQANTETKHKFYSADKNLVDMQRAWGTRAGTIQKGTFDILKKYQCDTTGSFSPHFNQSIHARCDLYDPMLDYHYVENNFNLPGSAYLLCSENERLFAESPHKHLHHLKDMFKWIKPYDGADRADQRSNLDISNKTDRIDDLL